jgi:hypothetical protein
MSSLPPALDFPKAEEEVCEMWAKESTFKTQNRLSQEREDEVRFDSFIGFEIVCRVSFVC